jgi:hypothetical protein
MSDTTELQIVIDSSITASNFAEYKTGLLAVINAANKQLTTDDEFAEAEQNVVALKASEQALKAAKEAALKKAEDVFQLFNDIDDVAGSAAEARLALSKQIKDRKDQIKKDAVTAAVNLLSEHIDTLNPVMIAQEGAQHMKQATAHVEDAVKGKRSVKTMQQAVDTVVGVFTEKFNQRNTLIEINLEVINAHQQNNPALFSDANTLACTMTLDQLKNEIQSRLDKYKEQEAAKQKAAEAQENELKLRREMEDKAAAEKAEQEKAEREKAASEQQPSVTPTAPEQPAAPQQQDLPASMQGLKKTIADESAPVDTYQITIVTTSTQAKAAAMAKAIKQQYGDQMGQIKLFKINSEKAA